MTCTNQTVKIMMKAYLRNGVLGCRLDVSELEQGPVVDCCKYGSEVRCDVQTDDFVTS
jgi:hypothetical protein